MPPIPSETPRAPRRRLLPAVLAVLCMVQLVALWMFCSHQVRKAQMRDISLQVQRVGVADCLRYVPDATLSSCTDRMDPAGRGTASTISDKRANVPNAPRAKMSSTVRAGVAYH